MFYNDFAILDVTMLSNQIKQILRNNFSYLFSYNYFETLHLIRVVL